jgi:hypothetical protein
MDNALREIVHDKVPSPMNLRVFCNSIGCLCYVEPGPEPSTKAIVYGELLGETGQKLGITKGELDAIVFPGGPSPAATAWELTVVRRPSGQ